MVKSVLWTESRARLQLLLGSGGENVNWLFLPGGPGLGSESLLPLLEILKLPGSLWLFDLPGDGSNTTLDNVESFSKWPVALIEAVSQFDQVVLVAHSTGGMYALSVPELESHLKGLVLLDSAPNAGWQASFTEIVRSFPIPGLQLLQETYEKNPNNQTLKELTLASAPYLFTQRGQASGIELLRSLPYNYKICQWSEKHFDRTYQAKWVPKTIPTLILSGEEDLVTPLKLFQGDKRFSRKNITFQSIKGAGHFPWIENPAEVAAAFSAYANQLME
jgi:Predicted hydrolases or acyltransferases (alpha/beta hydrolase superfamily)